MPLDTFNPIWVPARSFTRTSKPTVTNAQFGDGYSQRTRFGINTITDSWSLSFTNNSNATANAILAFLEGKAGAEAFYWTPPYESTPYKVICQEWTTEYTSHISKTIQCTFTRVYDVDVA